MNKARVRIGRVTLKGGAELKVFRSKRDLNDETARSHLATRTDSLAQSISGYMAGFISIAWDDKRNVHYTYHFSPDSPYQNEDLPRVISWVVNKV
jgi:hypothetical protein